MFIGANLVRKIMPLAVATVSSLGLAGCFDLSQKVALHRDGSGSYAIAISADGIVGEGLGRKHADIDIDDEIDAKGVTTVTHKGDVTTQTKTVAFRDLSDLHLGDETLSLHVIGQDGGATKVAFHRSFRIDHDMRDRDDERGFARDVVHSIFGDHQYTFALWLPGRIDRIAPVKLGNRAITPVVWGDASGHTIIWKMPLSDMLLDGSIDFDVDFAANGQFHDTQTLPGKHHHNRHHDDDDVD